MSFVIRIVITSILGFVVSYLSKKLIPVILNKRNRVINITKNEDNILSIIGWVIGGLIGFKYDGLAMISYTLLLLGLSIMIGVIDFHERIIPNELWQSIIILKLIYCIPSLFGIKGFETLNLLESIIGYVVLFIIFLTPSLFKKNVGAGDIKLAAAIGFSFGIYNALCAVIFMGLMIIAYTTIKKDVPFLKTLESMIPMGPFIVSGMMGVLLFI